MYLFPVRLHQSAVRRSFLARRTGQSPATAAAGPLNQHGQGAAVTTLGAAAEEAAWADNDVNASSQTVEALLTAQEASSAKGEVTNAQHGLMKAALSADEGDLPLLSLVLDMALSILFARAAIVNLLSHVRAAIGSSLQCPPRTPGLLSVGSAEPERPWWWVQQPTAKGCGPSTSAGGTIVSHAWGNDGGDGDLIIMEIAQGVLEAMTAPENQRRIIDLTKEFISWSVPELKHCSLLLVKRKTKMGDGGCLLRHSLVCTHAGAGVVVSRRGLHDKSTPLKPRAVLTRAPVHLHPGTHLPGPILQTRPALHLLLIVRWIIQRRRRTRPSWGVTKPWRNHTPILFLSQLEFSRGKKDRA